PSPAAPITHPRREPLAPPAVRLFCFAHAGGGASAFRSWIAAFAPAIEVVPVQLPGREERLGETAFTRMESLIENLSLGIDAALAERPCVFFGHSLGAKVAYALARARFERGQAGPRLLIVSGCPAPHLSDPRPRLHGLPTA